MQNLPTNLMNQLKDLHDNFEDHFLQSERERVVKMLRDSTAFLANKPNPFNERERVLNALRNGGLPQDYQHKGVTMDQESGGRFYATGNDTDIHGNPIAVDEKMTGRSPANWFKLTRTDVKVLGYLEKGFIAVPTIAGNLSVKRDSVHNSFWRLKQQGYEIESRPTGKRKQGYDKIYRIKTGLNKELASG